MNKLAYGAMGEALAKKYLVQQGYKILETNFRSNLGEIDLIVTDNYCLVFVEVKARSDLRFGRPSEAVTPHKRRKIASVATQYIKMYQLQGVKVRFDIVEVLDGEINHIKDAFDSHIKY